MIRTAMMGAMAMAVAAVVTVGPPAAGPPLVAKAKSGG